MKKLSYVLLAALLMFAVACGKKGGSAPKDVAISFAKSMSRGDYDGAKSYATDDTKKAIDQVKTMAAADQSKKKEEGDYEVISETIDGASATVKIKNKKDNKESEVYLKQVNKNWLVSMDKQQLSNKGGSDKKETTNDENLGSKDDSKSKYKIGTKVGAMWMESSSKYYPGEIFSIAGDAKYYVKWKDGSKPSEVVESKIIPMNGDLKIKTGDKVQALWNSGSTFWDATVKKVMASEKKAVITWTSDKKDATVAFEDMIKP